MPVLKTLFPCAAAVALAAACHGSEPSRFPAREPGCDVRVFNEDAPNIPTENIGAVRASCDDTLSVDDCMRTLKDEGCKLGANVIWGVSDEPVRANGKIKLAGRAAHTK